MSSSIKQYGQVITNFLNEVSIYNKIEKAEINSNERIKTFQKFIAQNKSLLSNFTGVEKHISYFIDTYKFEQIFDYSIIENSIPNLQILSTKLNLLLDKTKQIISSNKRYTNDKFVIEIKNTLLSCKEKMTLRDITTKIKEVDKILAKTDSVLTEINTLNSQITNINQKLQQINSYFDRYNKVNEINKAQKLIKQYNNVTQISEFSQQIQAFTKQNQIIDNIINSFDNEKQQLKKVQISLSSNVNLWKEDANYYNNHISSLLPKLFISKFEMSSFLNEIAQKENNKKQDISNYENSISEILSKYSSWINDFKTQQKSKVEFEQLKKKIANEEADDKKAKMIRLIIIISIVVAVVTVVILGIIYPEWVIPIVIIGGIIAFIIWRKTKY